MIADIGTYDSQWVEISGVVLAVRLYEENAFDLTVVNQTKVFQVIAWWHPGESAAGIYRLEAISNSEACLRFCPFGIRFASRANAGAGIRFT